MGNPRGIALTKHDVWRICGSPVRSTKQPLSVNSTHSSKKVFQDTFFVELCQFLIIEERDLLISMSEKLDADRSP